MVVKDYVWYGFGFPVKFAELPAVELRGELVPDVDWSKLSEYFVRYICLEQGEPMSGNQVKFIRGQLGMSLRDFAKLLSVKHQSVMRWEKNGKAPAKIDSHVEVVVRTLVLRKLGCSDISLKKVFDKFESTNGYTELSYRSLPNLHVSKSDFESAIGIDKLGWAPPKTKTWSPIQKVNRRVVKIAAELEYQCENDSSSSVLSEESVYQVGLSYYSRNH